MKKQFEPDKWKGILPATGFIGTIIGMIAIQIQWPDQINGEDNVHFVLIATLVGAVIGAAVDSWRARRLKKAEPGVFVRYLAWQLSGAVRAMMIDHLQSLANAVHHACQDSIQFQQEELSRTGRAARGVKPEDITTARKKVADRAEKAKEAFYEAYDAMQPFATEFRIEGGRSWQAFVTIHSEEVV